MAEKADLGTRFTEKVDRFVAWLEKDRLSIITIFAYVIIVAVIRDLLEYLLLDQPFVTTPHPWIFSIAHHVSFYVVVFLGLIFLLSAFSGRSVRRVTNFVVMFWWIIILPPVIDHYIGGLNTNYAYFSFTDFINAFFHFSGETFHIGQATEVIVILFALFAYTIWTQRSSLYTISGRTITAFRVGLLVFFAFLFIFVMGTPGTFLPVDPNLFPSFNSTRYYQYHLFFVFYYLATGIVLALVTTYFGTKGNFRNVFRSMRPAQTLFFAAIILAGIATGWQLSSSVNLVSNILATPYWVNLAFVGISVVSALLAWQVSTLWNDVSDMQSDEPTRKDRILAAGYLDRITLIQISLVLATLSLMLSLLLSIIQTLIIAAILTLSYVYSFKPVRFKARVLSPMLIGLGAFFAFVFGYITPYSVVALAGNTPYLTGDVVSPTLTSDGFILGFFVFAGLVIGSMVTDIDGFAEDNRAGVRTIYTTIGLVRGKAIVAFLIVMGSLMPIYLLNGPLDLILFPALGIAAALMFWRTERSRSVIAVALVGLLYASVSYLIMLGG